MMPSMSTTTQPPKPKRRWYQFSLRTEDAIKRLTIWIRPFVLLVVVATPMYSAEPDKGQEAAIAAIRKLEGRVILDGNKAVVNVNFTRLSPDTDAGLQHVKGLTRLEHLDVAVTNVSDAGLEHVKGLKSLASLSLSNTKVTDTRLGHLKGMATLHALDLTGTKVTDEGALNLQQALPNCKFVRQADNAPIF